MDLKKKMKNFFTLTRKADGGFTLVELIVVIAILAILGGVAVPAYSGYVTKANKQADITLASEVAHALTLYYYSHPNEDTDGYVLLTTNGAGCDDSEVITAAMDAVFGDGWENTLSLKYDGWLPENADGSNALNTLPAETITSAVGSLTGLAGAASAANSNTTICDVLTTFCGLQGTEMQKELQQYATEITDTNEYATVATNLMVKYLADEISTSNVTWNSEENTFVSGAEGKALSPGADYAMQYAMLYSMANSTDTYYAELAKTQLTEFNTALGNIVAAEKENSDTNSVTDALDAAFGGLYTKPCKTADGADTAFMFVFQNYLDDNSGEISGISSALGAMHDVAQDYNSLETLSDENLFSSSAMTNAISTYQLAVSNGGIAVQIKDGKCYKQPSLS